MEQWSNEAENGRLLLEYPTYQNHPYRVRRQTPRSAFSVDMRQLSTHLAWFDPGNIGIEQGISEIRVSLELSQHGGGRGSYREIIDVARFRLFLRRMDHGSRSVLLIFLIGLTQGVKYND